MNDSLGVIYTPPDVAEILSKWAIQCPSDQVLDLGVGEGVFVFAALHSLVALGAEPAQAAAQIHGTEVNRPIYERFLQRVATTEAGLYFPHIANEDFFESSPPEVDAVIGNPPYVRRTRLSEAEVQTIRSRVLAAEPHLREQDISGLTDLYVYFLLLGAARLRQGGRLAVVVADSWLNARYGRVVKGYLKKYYCIEQLVSFDQMVFPNAQVRPVLVFAIKSENASSSSHIAFTRVTSGRGIGLQDSVFSNSKLLSNNPSSQCIPLDKLGIDSPWGVHFKISEISDQIENHEQFIPLGRIAQTRIGLQTLAKEFFALSKEQAWDTHIEAEFLRPFAYSAAQFEQPEIDERTKPGCFIFFCSLTKAELVGTWALEYILNAEDEEVKVRGKDKTVRGYHQKDRIIKANRPNWYDIKTEIERRGIAPILIPRLIYDRYTVLWNKADFVPGETLIECVPTISLQSKEKDIQLFLSILSSTLMEVLVRGYAQMYGGGTYTVSPSQIRLLPMPDVTRMSKKEQDSLVTAYQAFLVDKQRSHMDHLLWEMLGLDANLFLTAVEDLRLMAVTAKKRLRHSQLP